MKDINSSDLETCLNGLRMKPSAQLDESVGRMAEEAHEAKLGTQKPPIRHVVHGFLSIRRWAVAAAVLLMGIAGAFVAWMVFSGGASSAWAAVEESARVMPWVHVVQKDPVTGATKSETWHQASPARTYMSVKAKDVPGYVALADSAAREEWMYEPEANLLTIRASRREVEDARNSFLRKLTTDGPSAFAFGQVRSARRGKTQEGVTPFEIVTEAPENASGQSYRVRVWVDESLKLPVRAEVHGNAQEGGPSSILYLCEISYPKSGPADIYATGIPRDATVLDARPTKDISQILAEYGRHREVFPQTYEALLVSTSVSEGRDVELQEICVVRKDGPRHRLDIYAFRTDRSRQQPLTFDEARAAVKNGRAQLVSSTLKVEGTRAYWLRAEQAKESGVGGWKTTRVYWNTDLARIPEDIAWPPMSQMPMKQIANDAPDLAGLAGIEVNLHVRKDRYWFNPKRDLIAERWTLDPFSEGKPWGRSVLAYAQLSSGHWYPKRIRDDISGGTLRDIYMEVTEDPAFAPNTFDPASLRAPVGQ